MIADISPLTYFGIKPESREERILRLVIETVVEGLGADEGSLLVADPEGGDLRFAMTAGDPESERTLIGQRVPLGQGITGLAAATHDVQIGAPTYTDVRQTERKSGGPEAVLAAPMLIGDRLIGVVTAVSFAPGKRFDQGSARFAGRLATIAAVVVDQTTRLAALERAPEDERAAGARAEIERAIEEIARDNPEALDQLLTIVLSFSGALRLRGR